jgi:hypothetical protein
MPRRVLGKRLNLVDVMMLIMMVVGVIIAIHTILNAILPPSHPTTVVVVIPKLMPISLIAP